MTASVALMPIQRSEIELGKPLPWPVYDWHGNLLVSSGVVIDDQRQLDDLLLNGFVHDSMWDINLNQVEQPKPAEAAPAAPARAAEAESREAVLAMDEVRWYVGETLYLQQIESGGARYAVRLIGFVKNKLLFVTTPVADGKFEYAREGQTYVVRAFSGKKAYAFTASAVKSIVTPHPYLLLSYPKEVRCAVVRQGARAQVKIIASVSLDEPERLGAAEVSDLSIGGASGILKQALGRKGESGRIKFKVTAAGNDEYLNLKAILRSVAPAESGEGFRHGFEFAELSTRDRLILSAFVHQTLVEML